MYSLPDNVAKSVRIRATDSTLICRRSIRTQFANIASGAVLMSLGFYGLYSAARQHQPGFAFINFVLIGATAYFLTATVKGCRAQFVLDRDNDIVLDRGKPIGRVSAIERIGTCHKTGVTRVVARFEGGKTMDLCPGVLRFNRDDEAGPVAYLLEEFAGLPHEPQPALSVSGSPARETVAA